MLTGGLVKEKKITFRHKMINLYELKAVHHIQHVNLLLVPHLKVKYKKYTRTFLIS